jgi:endoglycosylceramidase
MRQRALLLSLSVVLGSSACSSDEDDQVMPTPPGASCTVEASRPDDWRLTADGTKLRDAWGREVLLRGVNAGGRSKFAPYVPFDFEADGFDASLARYLDRAAGWGIDAMRVPFTWAGVEPVEGMDDETFLSRYDALLDGAHARGIYTIVDFHQDIYAEALCGDGFPDWTLPDPHGPPHHDCPKWFLYYFTRDEVKETYDRFFANQGGVKDKYLALWDRMTDRHRDRPGVIGFEVFNEPSNGTAEKKTWEMTTLTSFYADVSSRVRMRAPSSLVFLDAPGDDAIEGKSSIGRPPGDGIVFAPHWYDAKTFVGGDPSIPDVKPGLGRWLEQGSAWNSPVLIGESGAITGETYTSDLSGAIFSAIEDLGMNFTYWEYSDAKERWNDERFSVVGPDGKEVPEVMQHLVRPYPRALAGTGASFHFDEGKKELSLTFQATADGVSEIVVPTRLFPGGYDFELTNACAARRDTEKNLLVLRAASAGEVKLTLHPKVAGNE